MSFDERHRRFAVAPMMELSDRHFRYLARLLSQHSLLYTEMLTCKAIIHGDRHYLLDTDARDNPLVLQLGGNDPAEMAEAALIGEQWGYDEINMNVGCPSDRVSSGRFGACLMAEPATVAACVVAMQAAVKVPVSVKCRLGIDRDDSYEVVEQFVEQVSDAGCQHFIVHARKAWLDGLSPKENRTIPPLRYEYVYRLKQRFSDLHITINGGIDTWEKVQSHLNEVDGVMCGRHAYYQPAFLGMADSTIFNDLLTESSQLPTAKIDSMGLPIAPDDINALAEVARTYAVYMQVWVERGVRVSTLIRHIIALFHNVPGARLWRRHLSENASKTQDAVKLIETALTFVLEPYNGKTQQYAR